MASNSQKAMAARGAQPKQQQSQRRQPDFVFRAKVREETKDGTRIRWIPNVGAMWSAKLKDGTPMWSVRLNSIPVGQVVGMIAVPPLTPENVDEDAPADSE